MRQGLSRKLPSLNVLSIVLLSLLIYSGTFDYPFHFDGKVNIVSNEAVKDFGFFLRHVDVKDFYNENLPRKASAILYSFFDNRYIGYLTFAVNYAAGGLDVWGYHAFNLAVHTINALLVYFLVNLIFKTPVMADSGLKAHSDWVAFLAAALFVTHPVQTQSVTYIVQRFASLATLFYLLSLLCYIKSRFSSGGKALGYYALSLISAVLAMKTKETAFTLPVAVALFEFIFFEGKARTRALRLLPLLLTMFIIPLSLLDFGRPLKDITAAVGEMSRLQSELSRYDYLLTQFSVVVTYLRLLFLPMNQNLDYDYPVYTSFLEPRVFISFLLLLALTAAGVYCLVRSKRGISKGAFPLFSYGVLCFFLTLSVESSLIPIDDVIFEHRLYLPSAWAFVAISATVSAVIRRLGHSRTRKTIVAGLVALPLIFAVAAYDRNLVWASELTLWQDVVKKSPRKGRGYNNAGIALGDSDRLDEAMAYQIKALKLAKEPWHKIEAHFSLGRIYSSLGRSNEAISHYRQALGISRGYLKIRNELASEYMTAGMIEEAVEQFEIIVNMDPGSASAHYNLALAYLEKGLRGKAVKELQDALELDPKHSKARVWLGFLDAGP